MLFGRSPVLSNQSAFVTHAFRAPSFLRGVDYEVVRLAAVGAPVSNFF